MSQENVELVKRGYDLWNSGDEFFYDVLHLPDGQFERLKVRSLVGLMPLLAVVLAGCTHMQTAKIDRHVIVGSVPEDYRTTHPIAIEEGVETLDLPAGLNEVGLTSGARDNIRGFAQAFLASGSAAIAIVTPAVLAAATGISFGRGTTTPTTLPCRRVSCAKFSRRKACSAGSGLLCRYSRASSLMWASYCRLLCVCKAQRPWCRRRSPSNAGLM